MNKQKQSAFSLMEAMIILVLISVAIMALVPLISKQLTFSGWKIIKENGHTYLTYGEKSNQHVGIGIDNITTLNNGKLVATNAAIGYYSDDKNNQGISLGRDYDGAGNLTVRAIANTNNKIRIGQHTCNDATKSISIGGFDTTKNNATNCPNSTHTIVQIGDGATTSISVTDTPTVTLKSGANNVINLNGNNFEFNLPNGTALFNYNATEAANGLGTLYFYQNIIINGDLTFETWDPAALTPDPANVSKYECLNYGPFVKQNDLTSRCYWFCNTPKYSGTGNPMCNVSSDKRLKNIKYQYAKSIDAIKNIETFIYTYKSDKNNRMHVGLIAQKIIGIFDEALHKDNKGYYSYEREPILYAMVNSVKDIYKHQNLILKEQYKANKKADKLLRKYKK